MSAPVKQVDNL